MSDGGDLESQVRSEMAEKNEKIKFVDFGCCKNAELEITSTLSKTVQQ